MSQRYTAATAERPIAARPPKLHRLAIVAQWIVGGAFILSSVPKLVLPDLFAQNVKQYGLFSAEATEVLVTLLPPLELLLGLLLLAGRWVGGALIWGTILLISFVGLQAWALSTGLDVDCGCFSVGRGQSPVNGLTLARAASLLAVSMLALGIQLHSRKSLVTNTDKQAAGDTPVGTSAGNQTSCGSGAT